MGDGCCSAPCEDGGRVESAKKRCIALADRVQALPLSKINDSCKKTLLRLINAELRFLSRLPASNHSISVNVGYLESVVHILELPFISGVSRVCKVVPLSHHKENGASRLDGVHVDIVCTAGRCPVWFLVSDRNPKYISWLRCGKNKGLGTRLKEVVGAACSTLTMRPTFIILFFSRGVAEVIRDKLFSEFGASELPISPSNTFVEVEEDWIYVSGGGKSQDRSSGNATSTVYDVSRAFQIKVDHVGNRDQLLNHHPIGQNLGESKSDMPEDYTSLPLNEGFSAVILSMRSRPLYFVDTMPQAMLDGVLINFDTTALVALVSGISNGACEKLLMASDSEMGQRFKGNMKFILEQVESEMQSPVLEDLKDFVSGSYGIICKSVHSEFKEILSMYGGPNETARANVLLTQLLVVPDCPSERMMNLSTTRKVALKNKIIFGTGDYWRAPTLTANIGFVRAIAQMGMSLLTLVHRPRALTGD